MKNLISEQIKFIDTYLKNSEVEFFNVRLEIVSAFKMSAYYKNQFASV